MCTFMYVKFLIYVLLVLFVTVLIPSVKGDGCNELVCGSTVSKCLLTQRCQCKLPDCSCCKDCFHCLGDLFIECCSCLDICPKDNDTLSALAPASLIGDFEGNSVIFDSFAAEEDDKWSTIRLPTISFGSGVKIDQFDFASGQLPATVNCTVIYWNACTTSRKCLQDCRDMGSKKYRWFHDGCCECVGTNCFNYGINESRCSDCPEKYEEDDTGENANYGEDEINYAEDEGDIANYSGDNADYREDEKNYEEDDV